MEQTTTLPAQPVQQPVQDDTGFSVILKESWEIFKANWSAVLGASAVVFVIQFFFGAIQRALQPDAQTATAGSQLVGMAGGLVSLFLSAGFYDIFLKLVRRQQTKISDLFSRQDALLPLFLSSVVLFLILGFGFLFLVIPGLYLMVKYLFVPMLSVDQRIGPMESFSRAAKLTDGRKISLIGFFFGLLGFNLLGVLALGIGLIITLPVSGLAQAMLYDKLLIKSGVSPQGDLTPPQPTAPQQPTQPEQ